MCQGDRCKAVVPCGRCERGAEHAAPDTDVSQLRGAASETEALLRLEMRTRRPASQRERDASDR